MSDPHNYLLPGEDPDAFEDPAVADEFDGSLLDGDFDDGEEDNRKWQYCFHCGAYAFECVCSGGL